MKSLTERISELLSTSDDVVWGWLRSFRAELPGTSLCDICNQICMLGLSDWEALRVIAHILDEGGVDRKALVRVMRRNRRKIWTVDDNPEFGRCCQAQAQAVEFALLDIEPWEGLKDQRGKVMFSAPDGSSFKAEDHCQEYMKEF